MLSGGGAKESESLIKPKLFSCKWSRDHNLAHTALQPAYHNLMTSRHTIQIYWINFNRPRLYGAKQRMQLSYPEHGHRAEIHSLCDQVTCIPDLALALNHRPLLGLSLIFLNIYMGMGLALSSTKSLWSSQYTFPLSGHIILTCSKQSSVLRS